MYLCPHSKPCLWLGRFVEIPALHQSAIFRRAAVEDVLAIWGCGRGGYRDGPLKPTSEGTLLAPSLTNGAEPDSNMGTALGLADGAFSSLPGSSLDVPVDLWWWLGFFARGKKCGKLDGAPLFGWRQHPRQHTRTHGRRPPHTNTDRRPGIQIPVCRPGPRYL